MKPLMALALILAAPAAYAQDIIIETLDIAPLTSEPLVPLEVPLGDVTNETVVEAVVGEGALLRALDRLTGEHVDLDLPNGYSANVGPLRVDMAQCRYPADNPTGEAYAFVSILDEQGEGQTRFQGWMIASSPALNALDHARYDVWLLRCKTSEAEGTE